MAEPIPEAEAFIGYKLTEMASRNEHHEFEEIATRIARKRISSNILIANGPVSAGGDQQRDAESYATRIPEELPHSAGFSASASTKPTVIACTVQQPPLKAKVLADLAGICAEDADPVEHIAFFSVHSIPAAAIHDLKKTARDDYGITLDIFSGRAISTLLAEPDLVWVAQQYLDLPSSMIPPLDEEESAPGMVLRAAREPSSQQRPGSADSGHSGRSHPRNPPRHMGRRNERRSPRVARLHGRLPEPQR